MSFGERRHERRRRCRDAVCYVNSNFIIGLDREEDDAISFASNNTGCLFTARPMIEVELLAYDPSRRRQLRRRLRGLASRHGILLRDIPREIRARVEALTAWFITAAEGGTAPCLRGRSGTSGTSPPPRG